MLGSMVRLAGVALWMLLVAGCTADEGERCSSSDDCAERLACVQSICRDASRYCHDEPSFAKSCAREGLCTLKGDACVAGSEADCRQSTRCKEYGYCKLAATCCSRDDGHCLSTEEHPLTHIERLSEAKTRDAAIDKIVALYESALARDGGDPTGPNVAPLLTDIVPPLAAIARTRKLPPKRQAQLLTLLASSRHPKAARVLVQALRLHRVDAQPPTPIDAAMAEVVAAVADMKLDSASSGVFTLFTSLHASWRKAEVDGFGQALAQAVMVLADASWERKLIDMVSEPMSSRGDVTRWRDQLYWQRVAARALGRLRPVAAVEPLMRVALSPRKTDVADAAIEGLVAVGTPAVPVVTAVLAGDHGSLVTYAEAEHAAAVAADVGDVAERSAEAVRIEVAARILAQMGRADRVSEIVAAMEATDDVGKARIAIALTGLPRRDAVVTAFKQAYETVPQDLPISRRYDGVAAISAAAPWLFDAALVPWIVDRAVQLEGGNTRLAPLREAAMVAALRLMTDEQAGVVKRLGALITATKWERDFAAADGLVRRCRRDVSCYLQTLQSVPVPEAFIASKAAVMVGMYGGQGDVAGAVEALRSEGRAEVRRALAKAVDRLALEGGATLAAKLEQSLRGDALSDPVVAMVIGRLRARGR